MVRDYLEELDIDKRIILKKMDLQEVKWGQGLD
jgi:hypothetical protein